MIVDANAYIVSLVLVLLCSVIRDFLIPLIVWRKYLLNKSYSYRFWFCLLTQAALEINLVYLLGFFNILNRFSIIGSNVLIYSFIIWNFSDKQFFYRCKVTILELWEASNEERLVKYLTRKIRERSKTLWRSLLQWQIWKYIRKNWLETILLTSLVLYNIYFLTHFVMKYHSYQFPDIPVHQSWIYGMEKGKMFFEGVYPYGMHIMILILRVFFQLNLREILLYSGTYQTVLLIIGIFLLAKQIFYGKYTPITVAVVVSLMLNQSRYAAALPQEAAMYAVIGLAYFMFRYLKQDRKKSVVESDSRLRSFFRMNSYINRRYLNSDALFVMICVSLVIAYHFFTAIAAIFMVIAIGLAYLPKVLKKQYFVPLMFCGIMGAVIAVLPMAAFLARGVPFNGSMNWATSVIEGKKWQGAETKYETNLNEALGENVAGEGNEDTSAEDETKVKIDYSKMSAKEIVIYVGNSLFSFASTTIYNEEAILVLFVCMLLGFLCSILMILRKKTRSIGQVYLAIIINMFILCIFGAAKKLGIVQLIEVARIATFAEPISGFIYIIPLDFAFRIAGGWKNRYYQAFLRMFSLFLGVGIASAIILLGWVHSFFYFDQAYYNESEYALRNIKKTYPKDTYTIVSPTEEYYDVLDYGYHTQLAQFMDMVNGNQKLFTFPTKYVFFFIEKHVLNDYIYGYVDVNLKYAAKNFAYLGDVQDYYYQRAVIESQAYYWAQEFKKRYPDNFKVYFEDDIYVVYMMQQNVYSPYDPQIDYLSDYADEIKAIEKKADGTQ